MSDIRFGSEIEFTHQPNLRLCEVFPTIQRAPLQEASNSAANRRIHLTEIPAEPLGERFDDGDEKIIETWEVVKEHPEG